MIAAAIAGYCVGVIVGTVLGSWWASNRSEYRELEGRITDD